MTWTSTSLSSHCTSSPYSMNQSTIFSHKLFSFEYYWMDIERGSEKCMHQHNNRRCNLHVNSLDVILSSWMWSYFLQNIPLELCIVHWDWGVREKESIRRWIKMKWKRYELYYHKFRMQYPRGICLSRITIEFMYMYSLSNQHCWHTKQIERCNSMVYVGSYHS